MPYSAAASGIRSRRPQLLAGLGRDLLGHAGLGDRLLRVRRSRRAVPSSSPSSFWIVASCSRSMASRWRFSSVARVWLADLARQPQHLQPVAEELEHRVEPRRRSMVSSTSCFSAGLMSMVGGGDVGQRAGRVIAGTVSVSPCGACGSSSMTSSAWPRSRGTGPRPRSRSLRLVDQLDAGDQERTAADELDDPEALLRPGRSGDGCRRVR